MQGLIKKNVPLVSIIMNCYNSSEFLHEAVESIFKQTYQNWELIFWDNQSTDTSASIIKRIKDNRIKYYYSEKHTPLSEARNLAINKAKGEWLAFLDCDDIWMDKKLELQIDSINFNSRVGVVYSPFMVLINTTNKENTMVKNLTSNVILKEHGPKNIYSKLLKGNFIIFSGVMLKKSIFELTGGFSLNFVHNEDYEILLKSCLKSFAICLREPQVYYRIHNSNYSYCNDEIKYSELNSIFESLPDSPLRKRAISRNFTRYAIYKFREGKYAEGLNIFFKRGSLLSFLQIIKYKLDSSNKRN